MICSKILDYCNSLRFLSIILGNHLSKLLVVAINYQSGCISVARWQTFLRLLTTGASACDKELKALYDIRIVLGKTTQAPARTLNVLPPTLALSFMLSSEAVSEISLNLG